MPGYITVLWRQLPDNVEEKGGKLYAEGGRTMFVDLPPDGWRVPDSEGRMFHEFSGTALATLPFSKKGEAETALKKAGYSKDDLSRHWRGERGYGTRAVWHSFLNVYNGPFNSFANRSAGYSNPDLGVRLASRSEQDAKHLANAAEKAVLVPVTEYEMLRKTYELAREIAAKTREFQ